MSTVDIAEFVNVQEAADIIGCTGGRIRQMLTREKCIDGARKINRRAWLIPRQEAERLRDIVATVGRPRRSEKNS
jgi:hypothetical protein